MTLNYEWRRLVSEALQYYFDWRIAQLPDAEIDDTRNQFSELLNDLYTAEMMGNYRQAERVSTQAIPANTITKIQFQTGANPPQDWDIPASYDGICTITARVAMTSAVAGIKYARLLHNGNEIVRADIRSTGLVQWFHLSHVLEVIASDVFNLEVHCTVASTVTITEFTPKVSMVIV